MELTTNDVMSFRGFFWEEIKWNLPQDGCHPGWWLPHPFIIFNEALEPLGPKHADPHVAARVAANHSTTSWNHQNLGSQLNSTNWKIVIQKNGQRDTIRETERQPGGQTSRAGEDACNSITSIIASIAPFVLFGFLVPIRVIPCWWRASCSHTLPQCQKNAIISQIFVIDTKRNPKKTSRWIFWTICESMSNRPARYPRPSGCQCNLLLTKKPGGSSKKMPKKDEKRQPKKKLWGFWSSKAFLIWAPKPSCLEVVMVVNLVIFRLPKPLFFMVFWVLVVEIPTESKFLTTFPPPPTNSCKNLQVSREGPWR